ncbi:DUF1127 domain-containing protein [Phaeobacter italicus]|jgi:uncharacterized protein YjiS (DUF1127 family)|uniref:DUF1127 domain-containing protein n=1 Tax=Phaeobacter italicus TaxID=481446 RepID=A0A0H5CWU4_9RHOB|nr:DUF1127 domain-containing protein [Phaeobacter italicus]EEB72881.1 conserved hypothetical protein [Ruegeria sp. R11]MEE2817617.1 DUF1127 domain-containing protein [Pseudomonadota bacterium]MCI5099558.1 DUF1127 domain-containing protein [Phaeobacter italicus]CRL09204.1 hypothetical protein NIT7321_00033 [Phaeobacter italicus]CRL15998.1 hypothetical protein NIT7645_03058 [Phaeobacter italicus]
MTYMDTLCSTPPRAQHSSILGALINRISLWRERQTLAKLDDAALLDLGISARAAAEEARRSFWDVPTNRAV